MMLMAVGKPVRTGLLMLSWADKAAFKVQDNVIVEF